MVSIERRASGFFGGFFPLLLFASVYGFAASLLVGRATQLLIHVCAASVAIGLASGRRLRLDRPLVLLLALAALLLIQGNVVAAWAGTGRTPKTLLWSACIVLSIVMQAEPANRPCVGRRADWLGGLAVIYVAIQTVAVQFRWKWDEAGTFDNIHYLALYSVLTAPLLFYFALTRTSPVRWLYVLALLADFYLLLKTQSRPGFLALIAAAAVTVPFLSKRSGLAAFGSLLAVPGILYVTGILGFSRRVDDLALNLFKDERFTIWRETLSLQQNSSPPEWLFGHGFGGFHTNYRMVSSFYPMDDFSFPHNFFLELLYSHGVIGLILVPVGYVLFFRKLVAATVAETDPSRRRIGVLLTSIGTGHLVHAFLTVPFFSRPSLYSLSLIVGSSFYFWRTANHDE